MLRIEAEINPLESTMLRMLPIDRELSITEAWEERAAILEFDAGYSREHAEALATKLIT